MTGCFNEVGIGKKSAQKVVAFKDVDILKGRLVWNIIFLLGCAIIFWLHVMLRRSSGIDQGHAKNWMASRCMGLLEVAGPTSALLAPALAMVTTASPRKAVSTHVPTFSASYGTSPHCLCKVGRRTRRTSSLVVVRQTT